MSKTPTTSLPSVGREKKSTSHTKARAGCNRRKRLVIVALVCLIAVEIKDQPIVVQTTPAPAKAHNDAASGITKEEPVTGVMMLKKPEHVIATTNIAETPLTS